MCEASRVDTRKFTSSKLENPTLCKIQLCVRGSLLSQVLSTTLLSLSQWWTPKRNRRGRANQKNKWKLPKTQVKNHFYSYVFLCRICTRNLNVKGTLKPRSYSCPGPAHRPPPTPHTSLSFTAIAIPSTCCQLGTAYPCTSVSALHVCQCLF